MHRIDKIGDASSLFQSNFTLNINFIKPRQMLPTGPATYFYFLLVFIARILHSYLLPIF